MSKKTISEFLSTEYKDFAMYVVEGRAIPSVIDGFKPTQRKIIHVCNDIWKNGSEKPLKVFQLAGKVASDAFYHHGNCLDPDTEILLQDGSFIKIVDWFENFPDSEMCLVSYDEDSKQFVVGIGHSPRVGQTTDIEYEIEMENGEIFKCTPNHPFLTERGWITAENLGEDVIKNIDTYKKILSIKINKLSEPKKFYDITVDKYHNFVIGKSMIVTHNSSLENSIVNMAQGFKNNMSLLDEIGQFGSLRSTEPGAPRYIGTKLNKNFRLLYRDFELLDHKEEEGQTIEPRFFLPIVPTVLINGSSGIAVGFASNILNRNPIDMIVACESVLKGKKFSEIKPYNHFFTGDYVRDPDNPKRWFIRGKLQIANTTTVRISELPPSMTYEKYETLLDELVEKKTIVSYDDNCKDNIDYTVKFTRESLSQMNEEKLMKILKLEETETENFSTLDENGKLKIFDSDIEIIQYFVSFRLSYYIKRKEFLLEKLKYDLKVLANRGRFIKYIIDGKLEIKNKSKDVLVCEIGKLGLEMIDDSYDYLLRMPIWSLTKELFDKLKDDYRTKKSEVESLSTVEPRDMYLSDLNELKKKIK